MHLPRTDPRQQGERPRDHQALDMVCIGLARRLVHHGPDARHAGLAGPVEGRQVPRRVQVVQLRIVRHLQPVDATHIFPPADDLADEPLGGVQRHVAIPPGPFHALTEIQRIEQPDVDAGRQHGVIQEVLAPQHGILIVAEMRQGLRQETVARLVRLLPRHGEPERLQVTESVGKPFRHQPQHRLRHVVGTGLPWAGHEQIGLGGFPVLLVEVPLPASRFLAIHQQTGLPAHLPIEVLHAQLLAASGPFGEFRAGAEEAIVRQDIHGQARIILPARDHLRDAPFPRFRQPYPVRPVTLHRPGNLAREAAGVAFVIKLHVIDLPAIT